MDNSSNTNKKRGRVRVFKNCFRSSAADDDDKKCDEKDVKRVRSGKPVLIAVTAGNGKTCFFSDEKSVNGRRDGAAAGDSYHKWPSNARRRISRALKAVWFDAAIRKNCNRKSSKSSVASEANLSPDSNEKNSNSSNKNYVDAADEYSDGDDSSSRCSNLLSSSSRTASSVVSTSCSSNSNSRSSSDRKGSCRVNSLDLRPPPLSNSSSLPKLHPSAPSNPIPKPNPQVLPNSISLPKLNPSVPFNLLPLPRLTPGKTKSGDSNGSSIRPFFLFIVSLFVLVMWGRICSIFCTTIGFYLMPRRRVRRVDSSVNATESVDYDSEQYKKGVIMRGLLDRSR